MRCLIVGFAERGVDEPIEVMALELTNLDDEDILTILELLESMIEEDKQ